MELVSREMGEVIQMPHSLRVRLKNLNYKGLLTDKELNRLVGALNTVDRIEDIKADIGGEIKGGCHCDAWIDGYEDGLQTALDIINKHMKEEIE